MAEENTFIAPAEKEPKRKYPFFSFGAFFFNWIFALVHRQWLLAGLCFFTGISIWTSIALIENSLEAESPILWYCMCSLMAVHFILMIYMGFSEYKIAEKSGRYETSESLRNCLRKWNGFGVAGVIFTLFSCCFAVDLPSFLRAMDKAKFNRCAQTLSALKTAEGLYVGDKYVYAATKDIEKLGIYMIPECTNEKGCGTAVSDRTLKNCKDFEIKISADGKDYQIIGTAMDRTSCCICVNSKGFTPESYTRCPSCPAQCPK